MTRPGTHAHASAAIGQCITRCVQARDGRGAWRAESFLRQQLAVRGSAGIAAETAAAARRIGEWLRDVRA